MRFLVLTESRVHKIWFAGYCSYCKRSHSLNNLQYTIKSMKHQNCTLTSTATLVLAITASVYGGDYSPTSPVRPSAGLLNDWLHTLEDRQGRRRDVPRFSSRTLDVDIVLFGDRVLKGPGNLEVPRTELKHAFVLKPLADIAADVVHPVLGKTIGQLWKEFPAEKDHSERVPDLDH